MQPPPKVGKKITRDQIERRERFVEERLAGLVPLLEVYRAFEREFGVGRRTAERYARRVYDRWALEGAATREQKRAEIERAADQTYRDARARNDTRAQVAALALKVQLHGLNRPDADAPAGDLELVIECEAAPADAVPVAADVAPGGDPGGVRALPRPGGG